MLGFQTPPPGADPPPGPGTPPPDQAHHPPRPGIPPPQADTPPGPGTPPPKEADASIRSMSGRYASYWNAFLLFSAQETVFNECKYICWKNNIW